MGALTPFYDQLTNPQPEIGGGGGFTLGPEQNVFTGANRAAAEAARDAYAVDPANTTWLPAYNDDTNLNIRLEYGDTVTFQVRNEAGDDWLDNSSSVGVQGPPGQDGQDGTDGTDGTDGVTDLTNVAPNTVPVANAAGDVLISSALKQTTSLVATMPFSGPGERVLDIGPISAVSEGSTVSFLDRSRGLMFGAVVHDTTKGSVTSRRPFYFEPVDDLAIIPAVADTSETFTTTTLQFIIPNQALGTALQYQDITRPVGSLEITGCNLTIRRNSHTDEVPVFDYFRDVSGGTGFTLPAGASVTTIDLVREYLFLLGENLFVTITGDGTTPLNIQGQTLSGQTVPHVAVQGRTGTIKFLADITDVPTTASIQETARDTLGATLVAGENITITVDDDNNTITVASTGGGGGGVPQADHTNYIDVTADNLAASVDTGTAVTSDDLNPTVTLETFTGNRYVQILQSMAHSEFETIVIAGISQKGGFTITENARTIDDQAYRQYVTTNLITDALSGATLSMTGAV